MAAARSVSDKPILIYDADCGFCQKSINIYQRLDILKRTKCIPLQNKEILDRYQISFEKAATSIHFCTKKGTIYRGARAVNASLDRLVGSIPIFSFIYHIPVIKWIQNKVYDYIADNRYRLPGSTGTCALTQLKEFQNHH